MWNQYQQIWEQWEQVLIHANTNMEEKHQEPGSSQELMLAWPQTAPASSQTLISSQTSTSSNKMEIARAIDRFKSNLPFCVLSPRNPNPTPPCSQLRSQASSSASQTSLQQASGRLNNDRLQLDCKDENSPPTRQQPDSETSLVLKLVRKDLDKLPLFADTLTVYDEYGRSYRVSAVSRSEMVDRGADTSSEELSTSCMSLHKANSFKRNSAQRQKKTNAQLKALKQEFKKNNYPKKEDRLRLAAKLGLSDCQVRLWFQHERNKSKVDQKDKH